MKKKKPALDLDPTLNATGFISLRFSIRLFPQGFQKRRKHFIHSFTKERQVQLHKDLSCAILFTSVCLLTSDSSESWYFYCHAIHSIGFSTLLHLIINKVQRYPPLSHTDLPAKHGSISSSYLKLFITVWINTVLAVDALVLLKYFLSWFLNSESFEHHSSCCCLHSSHPSKEGNPVCWFYRHLLVLFFIHLRITFFFRIPCSHLLTKQALLSLS